MPIQNVSDTIWNAVLIFAPFMFTTKDLLLKIEKNRWGINRLDIKTIIQKENSDFVV